MAKHLPARRAIDEGGFLQLQRRRLEITDHDPDHDRHGHDQVDDDLGDERAEETEPLEHEKQRNEIGQPRRDARDQDHDRGAMRVHARDAVAGRHADEQRRQRRRAGDDEGVHEIRHEAVGREHVRIVLPRKAVGDQDRRIARIVDLELDREREHPDEEQDRRRHDDEHRERQSDLAEDLPQAHAPPPASFQCMRWRRCSITAASATMMAKNTTAIAEP